jgi:hypothetical protein
MRNDCVTWDALNSIIFQVIANLTMIGACIFIFGTTESQKLTFYEGVATGIVIMLAFLFLNSILWALNGAY